MWLLRGIYTGNPVMRLYEIFCRRIKGKVVPAPRFKDIKKWANVCLFAEKSTFNSITRPISLRVTSKMSVTLITYRLGRILHLPGGRGLRKGPVSGGVVGIYPPEMLKSMTPEEVTNAINEDIYEDAFDRQTSDRRQYRGKYLAERLELALYICPKCEQIGTLKSTYDMFKCSCGFSAQLNEDGFFIGEDLPFITIKEWDEWGCK